MEIDEIRKILPEPDIEYLISKGYKFDVFQQGGDILIIIHAFGLPEFYKPREASLLIVLPAGYPSANPDMFWTYPDVTLKDGPWPKTAEVHQEFLGKNWQRWSRHLSGGWRPGIDCLRTYVATISRELEKGL
jgi:hypothetical protein